MFTKDDVKTAIMLSEAYYEKIEEGVKDSKEYDAYWDFVTKKLNGDTYSRSLAISLTYDGRAMGLSVEQITEMLSIAGLVEEGVQNV